MANTNNFNMRSQIAGYEKVLAQLEQLRDFLHNADKYTSYGVRCPKGSLLYGLPGVGKTVMAKAIADDGINTVELRAADCTSINSEELIEKTFERAKNSKPCLLLIDELDKIAGFKEEFYMENNDKAMKILLQEIDSLKDENGVLVVATCNNRDSLNEALTRSGRFDRVIEIGLPTFEDRKKILNFYFDKIKMDNSLDIDYVTRVTTGFSGAQLECLVNETGILTVERGLSTIDHDCFQTALNRINFKGIEGEIVDSQKHLMAVHEAGHAVIALYLNPNSIVTASIVPQGQSNGHVGYVFELGTNNGFETIDCTGLDSVAVSLGGKVAETIEFGKSSLGCISDLNKATMSLDYIITRSGIYGYEYLINNPRYGFISDSQREKIVNKRTEILNELHEKVKGIIIEHKEQFDRIVTSLEEKHTLSHEELLQIIS